MVNLQADGNSTTDEQSCSFIFTHQTSISPSVPQGSEVTPRSVSSAALCVGGVCTVERSGGGTCRLQTR